MKYIFKLLLVLLLLTGSLFAQENLKIPPYDNRLDKYPNTTEWYNHADTDSASAYNIALTYDANIQDYKLAEHWYKLALILNPSNVNALFNLAVLYDKKKQYTKAIKYYKRAHKANDLEAAYNLACLYTDLKKYNDAEKWYKEAIQKKNMDALKNLGRLYHFKLNNDVKAAEYFITLIDNKYPKERILNYLKDNWKLSDKTIKKGYEAQLKSTIIPEKLKYKGGI